MKVRAVVSCDHDTHAHVKLKGDIVNLTRIYITIDDI